jgi:hypothetical protein
MVLQVGDWMQGRRPCFVKEYIYILAKSKGVKAGWSNSQEHTSLVDSSKEDYRSKRGCIASDGDDGNNKNICLSFGTTTCFNLHLDHVQVVTVYK